MRTANWLSSFTVTHPGTDFSRSKEKKSGFGIGLAIAAAIAEKHGGSMKAEMDGEMLVISAFLPREHKQEGSGGKA